LVLAVTYFLNSWIFCRFQRVQFSILVLGQQMWTNQMLGSHSTWTSLRLQLAIVT